MIRILALAVALLVPQDTSWVKLKTEPYRGKQDDIFFVNPEVGWYGNGLGKIFRTADGGATWKEVLNKPGTFVRCLGFIDEKAGFFGNVGTDYFPGVTDTTPLYATVDGGDTWRAVEGIKGPVVKGLCAIEIVKKPFINAGNLEYKTTVYAGGRVGGPAFLMKSADAGRTWESQDLASTCGMILDVKFFDADNGLLCAASSADVEKANAVILATSDGGQTWAQRYRSTRPYELAWKCSFPTRDVGYATLLSYDPDPAASARFVLKTTDGGKSWSEVPLVDDAKCKSFGVAFADENTGWIGAVPRGFATKDGGKTWTAADFGPAVNKIRLLPTKEGCVGYAIGSEVHKLKAVVPAPRK